MTLIRNYEKKKNQTKINIISLKFDPTLFDAHDQRYQIGREGVNTSGHVGVGPIEK